MSEISRYPEAIRQELVAKIKEADRRNDFSAATRAIRQVSLQVGHFDAQEIEDMLRGQDTHFYLMAYEIPQGSDEYGFLPQEPDFEMPVSVRLIKAPDWETAAKVYAAYGLDYIISYALLAGAGLSQNREGTTASLREHAQLN